MIFMDISCHSCHLSSNSHHRINLLLATESDGNGLLHQNGTGSIEDGYIIAEVLPFLILTRPVIV
jgi:hypothetical protein